MSTKTLMIVGMGRSGTSLITQWINKCGLSVGDSLLGKAIGNIEGHFEDEDFLKIHEEILISNNLASTGLEITQELFISNDQKEKLKNIIDNKNRLHTQWGWKEPRTCLFFNIYKELIPEAKYLILVRDYKAVVDSLLRRDFAYIDKNKLETEKNISRITWNLFRRKKAKEKYYAENTEKYLKVCIAYNEAIIKAMEQLSSDDYIVVNYLYLKDNNKRVFELLESKWNFSLSYFDFNKVYRKELISDATNKILRFVKDRSLLEKAKELEENINRRMK